MDPRFREDDKPSYIIFSCIVAVTMTAVTTEGVEKCFSIQVEECNRALLQSFFIDEVNDPMVLANIAQPELEVILAEIALDEEVQKASVSTQDSVEVVEDPGFPEMPSKPGDFRRHTFGVKNTQRQALRKEAVSLAQRILERIGLPSNMETEEGKRNVNVLRCAIVRISEQGDKKQDLLRRLWKYNEPNSVILSVFEAIGRADQQLKERYLMEANLQTQHALIAAEVLDHFLNQHYTKVYPHGSGTPGSDLRGEIAAAMRMANGLEEWEDLKLELEDQQDVVPDKTATVAVAASTRIHVWESDEDTQVTYAFGKAFPEDVSPEDFDIEEDFAGLADMSSTLPHKTPRGCRMVITG